MYNNEYHRAHANLKYPIEKQVTDDNLVICYSCGLYKNMDEFDLNPNMWFRCNKDKRCKKCKHDAYKKRLKNNNYRKNAYEMIDMRYLGLMYRANVKGLSVDITKDYLHKLWDTQKGKCALSNILMTYISNCGRIPTNVSIDRIDHTKGYIKGNILLVCMAVNQMKSDLDMQTLLMFCNKIYENAAHNAAGFKH